MKENKLFSFIGKLFLLLAILSCRPSSSWLVAGGLRLSCRQQPAVTKLLPKIKLHASLLQLLLLLLLLSRPLLRRCQLPPAAHPSPLLLVEQRLRLLLLLRQRLAGVLGQQLRLLLLQHHLLDGLLIRQRDVGDELRPALMLLLLVLLPLPLPAALVGDTSQRRLAVLLLGLPLRRRLQGGRASLRQNAEGQMCLSTSSLGLTPPPPHHAHICAQTPTCQGLGLEGAAQAEFMLDIMDMSRRRTASPGGPWPRSANQTGSAQPGHQHPARSLIPCQVIHTPPGHHTLPGHQPPARSSTPRQVITARLPHLGLDGALRLRLHPEQHPVLLVPEAVVVRGDVLVQLVAGAGDACSSRHTGKHTQGSGLCLKVLYDLSRSPHALSRSPHVLSSSPNKLLRLLHILLSHHNG